MSINLTIPISAQPVITANIFSAAFNVPTVNRYDFTNTAANQNVNVLALERWAVYVIERINFSCNAPEAVYGDAIDTASPLPAFSLTTTVSNAQIFPNAEPLINYVDNLEVMQVFSTQQDNDFLRASFTGVFTQPGAIAGWPVLNCFLQMNIYKIQEVDWVKSYYDVKTQLGTNLNMQGCQ